MFIKILFALFAITPMQLHQLPSLNKKSEKRIGRGGRRGTYSGRGIKGQRSRSGHRIRPAVRELILRIPKRRGFANRPKSPKPFSLSIGEIAKKLAPVAKGHTTVDKNALRGIGILPLKYRGDVKLLGDGEIKFPLIVKGLKVSKSARQKIGKAGGIVEE